MNVGNAINDGCEELVRLLEEMCTNCEEVWYYLMGNIDYLKRHTEKFGKTNKNIKKFYINDMVTGEIKLNHIINQNQIRQKNQNGGETKNKFNEQKIVTNMVDTHPIILIINLNVNRINTSVKKQRLSEWIKTRPKHMWSIRNQI